ncbi:hypothetical protein PPSIR1_08926 [Plesiocystis pacifica SIR-1]|uniref:DUF3570 domain-containing protein n=1 Tax=Plesiocystis pacifica SIR-1 TaxID=391625 RepID=A6G714_9BACT|nr:DUF3570 domain-containing protein [Plesiocystis pacifica]EDM78290.1 hypothetical protein PPSIR1_08926 [Plesiocystis pacifica SIR-1]
MRRALNILLAALIVALVAFAPGQLTGQVGHAEDRVTVRGNYYRETSTRVLQPMVTFRKELPDERLTLEAEYLLDVISSASIGAGALALGGDRVFTEMRHETSLRASTKIEDWSATAFYRYSTETDYTGNNFGFGVSREFLQKTANVSLSYSTSFDRAFRITNNIGANSPWLSSGDTNLLRIHYLSAGYSHVLTKHLVAGVNLEGIHAEGPQDNPYRRARNGDAEIHPWQRTRGAASVWARYAIPKAKMALEPRYRFYADNWSVEAHAIDLRAHFRPIKHLQMRLRYRYYTQSEAYFWRNDGVWDIDYPWRSDDPKMTHFWSHTVGGRLIWELDGVSKFQGLGWLDGAWIEATYNHAFVRCKELSSVCIDQDFGYGTVRSTRFGDHRIGNLAFSLAF